MFSLAVLSRDVDSALGFLFWSEWIGKGKAELYWQRGICDCNTIAGKQV